MEMPQKATDITAWCRKYHSCRSAKITKHVSSPVVRIPVPERRFTHIRMNLVGPLPTSTEGNKYLLTIIDRTIRYLEAVALKDVEAQIGLTTFLQQWVSIQIQHPSSYQFICKKMGVQPNTTTACHPQSIE
jgi:hypothetical protein